MVPGDLGASTEHSSLQYRMVLALVVLELLLVFGVGLACVLVSLLLLRKVYEESGPELTPLSARDRDSETGAGGLRPQYSSVAGSERSRSDAEEGPNGRADSVESSDLSPSHAPSWLKWLTAW